MLVPLNDTKTMDAYITGVMVRADHHAKKVEKIIPVLQGLVMFYGTDVTAFKQNGGSLTNVAWFTSKATGTRYYFKYNYSGHIELRRNGRTGPVIATFMNDSTGTELYDVFSKL